jgi:carboxypeptidase Q
MIRSFRAAIAIALVAAVLPAQERVDNATIEKIKVEAMQHSKVMETMSWLTDVHGPRLTGSPITKRAGEWALGTLKGYGLSNAHFETWGPFGRGWTNERFSFQGIAPQPFQIAAVPRAWSPSTKGNVKGNAILVHVTSYADLQTFAGKLKGKFVMLDTAVELKPHFTPEGTRYTDEQLATMAAAQPPAAGAPAGRGGRGGAPFQIPFSVTRDTNALRFLETEGVGAVLLRARGDGGTIFTDNGNARTKDAAQVPMVHVSAESYGRMYRMLEKNVPVVLEMNMENKFYDDDPNSFNVLAEIPGTDPALKDEVVLIGGHFDSWHGGTGATDNAAGSATMMEAMRILQAIGAKPRRTIRIGLWTGEEQGLFGSRAYVAQHYGQPGAPTPEQAKFSAYFNVDNGTGKIRGVYQQGNAAVGPIFDAWMTPFKDIGMKTLTISNTGGTDHQSFDAVGLPGFQFIQDGIEYNTRTHHSNADVFERVQAEDMKFNSAVLASFAWQAAQRNEKLPRKAPPAPRPLP